MLKSSTFVPFETSLIIVFTQVGMLKSNKKKSLFGWNYNMNIEIHTNSNNLNRKKNLLARQRSCPEEPNSDKFLE